jgi:tRNA-dihydrouridine synthase B
MTLGFWEKLKPPILEMAPMCGVTDLPFRLMCKNNGADVVCTEMIMVQALSRHDKKSIALARIDDQERPVMIQLGGNNPEEFFKSAQMAKELGADGVDINFGCPAKKVVGSGSGVSLLRNLPRCYEIVQATMEGAKGLPVSIKTRSRIKDKQGKEVTSIDLLNTLKDLPIAAVMIHGRSFEAPWTEVVDYEYIAEVRKIWSGILLANGGIYEPEIAKNVLEITKADGLGLAHGVYGRPWIFRQIKELLDTGTYWQPTWQEKKQIAIDHAQLAFNVKGPHGLIELRKQLLWYVKGLENATDYRNNLVSVTTLDQVIEALNSIKG